MPSRKLMYAAATTIAALACSVASPAVAQEQMPSGPAPTAEPASTADDFAGGVPVDLAKLLRGVTSRLAGAVGYQYTIARNGQVVAEDGVRDARRPIDGQLDMTPTSRIEVMSVTKNMTAIALLKLLDEKNVSVDAAIGKYLPLLWQKAGGFRTLGSNLITFRHLLTHTSGINQAMIAAPAGTGLGNDWDGLRNLVAYGATPNPAPGNYKNANFALMRLLIPRLTGVIALTEQTAYQHYLSYLNANVFAPAGVPQVTCFAPVDSAAALVYDATVPNGTGLLPEREGDDAADCGGHTGLHLSARDLAKVLVYLRHTEALMPADVRQTMLEGRLGWNEGSNNGNGRTDTAGVWWHGGDGTFSGREVHSCVMLMPQGYSASLIVNSQPGGSCGVLLNSFKESVQ